MPATRSSARQASAKKDDESASLTHGVKRQADESSPKAQRPAKAPKEQATLEQMMPNDEAQNEGGTGKKEADADRDVSGKDESGKEDTKEAAIEEDAKREKAQPENEMEKGIIYFFTRGRVGVEDPESTQDLQRSFFVLRPLAAGGKITDGAVQDVGNNRLFALPKKVWPKSGKDRFLTFVEKSGVSMDSLREEFFTGSDYDTKTVGTRHTPGASPLGEGVYSITWTGSGRATTHLAYMLTIPKELGEVQTDVGLAKHGSFVLSTKNPKSSGPANAQLPEGADYPQEVMDEFGSRGWLPTQPKHLDYPNAQILLIGESSGPDALEAAKHDQNDTSIETPLEELQKLEEENQLRVEHLKGDDTVFEDLGASGKDYPLKSTW
ncbi:hypothetical protein K470DRAFT_154592 [Piedraia hortae CBS 480.64]|uniref:BTB domain transcription factor n=1 Tax=Piedraia hortae CBS 480.64 TaxID=1314780 RepID=A0A6A7C6H0_9PEZI|nr:hypothetical protein K470DRAFT_154592 [Piedraia hortae CBS 480.64]